ncbi:glycosyltransferase family 2 protein [Micromonospora sp. NPDC049559]|uniref:glycosyltransferase family 2 protein n=1 Tax=Micromonospora sp. NPDC049559 TaxID=3155923 RepID=UPI003430D243
MSTVIVNYRHHEDTIRCVDSLQAGDYLNQQIIVVDNTERGASVDLLRAHLDPGVEVMESGGNNGFAAGTNVGIRRALDGDADFVWLVNPDATVSTDTLSALLATAEQEPDAGIFGARILDDNDPPRILFNGGVVDATRKGATLHQDAGRLDSSVRDDVVRDVDYVTGACFLVRRSVLRQIGLLPEEYFLYFEETDYCLRVRAAGWRTVIAPRARTWHFKRSTGKYPASYYLYYMCRNRIHFSRRFFSAEVDESIADLQPSIKGWRGRVEEHAPQFLGNFDKLIELAFSDAREGRLGRRDDINELAFS